MQFNEAWLREWVDPAIGTEELVHQLTMAGLEVDAVEPAAPAFSGVVVGEVKAVKPHPDADKLRLCQVSDGEQTWPVVCGAPNVREGMKAPFARVGAELPGDMKIKKAKLRGQPSEGMLCGGSELGLEDRVDGLLELPSDAPVGEDIRRYLALDDTIIEVDLTPNRADCLSLRGVAREVAALNGIALNMPAMPGVKPVLDDSRGVVLDVPSACPRYLGRVIRGVDLSAPSPLWLVERLRRAGLRPIDPVVDITNYVLLELGQPLHAFDLDRLRGDICVRLASDGETLTLLDGQPLDLRPDTLVIADDSGPLALAGIMGGEASAVGEGTTDIFLECAFFSPLAIAGKARSYGLHTDSSHRFERGVDPDLQNTAMDRATALILEVAGGRPGPVKEALSEEDMPAEREVELRAARIPEVLGLQIDADRVEDMLARLGMEVTTWANGHGWTVLSPSWRFDIEREEDLIEEVARLYGYDRLPSRLPVSGGGVKMPSETRVPLRRLADALVDRGYLEVITYSFVDAGVQRLVSPQDEPLALANPISSELAVMRTSLWPGLLTTARYNLNRQAERLRLFESGQRFINADGLRQQPMLAGLLYGAVEPHGWQGKPRRADFFDLKGDLEALLDLTDGAVTFEPSEHPALHPGQTARLCRAGETAGWLGRLHPALARKLDLPGEIYLFELELAAIQQATVPNFEEVSDQPSVRRDLAFILPETVPAGAVTDAVRRCCDRRLRELRIFDVYQGDRIEKGHKSLALGLTFQERSRTLKDGEVNELVEAVVSQLKQEFNAVLRDM